MRYASRQDKDTERTIWIIDQGLNINRVRAKYKYQRWEYWKIGTEYGILMSHSGLKPYCPNLITNASYWGDGPHYTTKKEALKDLRKLLKTVIKDTTIEYHTKLKRRIEELKAKLK
jgi:hypothetical protein